MNLSPYIIAVGTSAIFGFSFLFTKEALNYLTPYQLLAGRFFIAALTMFLLRAARLIKITVNRRFLRRILPLAFFQPFLYFFCETIGVNLTTSSEAGLMIALIPVFAAVFGAVFLQEIPGISQTIFILLSVAGVVMIVLGGEQLSSSGNMLGRIALMGAVTAGAVSNILSRRLSREYRPVELTYVMMWTGALVFGFFSLIEYRYGRGAGLPVFFAKPVLVSLFYLGILSSVVAFFGLNYTLSRLEASRSAVFSNLTTVVAVAAGVLLRGEPFYWYHLAGGVLIIAGVWGTNYFASSPRRFRPRRSPARSS